LWQVRSNRVYCELLYTQGLLDEEREKKNRLQEVSHPYQAYGQLSEQNLRECAWPVTPSHTNY
jgi:hypothetical protein